MKISHKQLRGMIREIFAEQISNDKSDPLWNVQQMFARLLDQDPEAGMWNNVGAAISDNVAYDNSGSSMEVMFMYDEANGGHWTCNVNPEDLAGTGLKSLDQLESLLRQEGAVAYDEAEWPMFMKTQGGVHPDTEW
jgi:hypothetical protein